jgi:type I restriction enzyme M protein
MSCVKILPATKDSKNMIENIKKTLWATAGKMQRLTETLGEQMAKGAELDTLIRQKLGGLGYEF